MRGQIQTSVALAATRKVGEWSRALVLTTHGHTDHVGNNDIADELGVPAEHYVPARDLGQMLDPGSYWVRAFTPIAGVVPLPAPPFSAMLPLGGSCLAKAGEHSRRSRPSQSLRPANQGG